MGNTVKLDEMSIMAEMQENKKNVREMVMESYHDMQMGKGRNYKEFFSEMESRYKNAKL